jgi:thiazole synthase
MKVGDDPLKVGGFEFHSRLLVGTGKYATFELMKQCLEISGCEVVTVALRRVNLDNPEENLLNFIDPERYTILPNTAGCYSADDAIKVCRLARELGIADLVKLEVIGDEKTLMPDVHETLIAAKTLVREGFTVLAYTTDDVVTAKKLEDAGVASVMPLGSPIGSGQGILNPLNIELIMEAVQVPVIVDAGVGAASDVAVAMEMGVDAVLLNTGIAGAQDPARMARAMRLACEAGRLSFRAGRIPKKRYATASSPIKEY